MNLTVKTLAGLEEICAQELQALGARQISTGRRMLSCAGDTTLLYRINLECRTALRVLVPIKTYTATSEASLYHGVRDIEWSRYMPIDGTLYIDVVNQSPRFKNALYLAQVAKDAIVDQFRSTTGRRPSVSKVNPDLRLSIHVDQKGKTTLSLDSSGDGLHRRGYRGKGGFAPLNEVLAAGMLLLSGFDGERPFVDPFCGSGTLIAEAAMIAARKAPGMNHQFGFQKWKDFDRTLLQDLRKSLQEQERTPPHPIVGGDLDKEQLRAARASLEHLGLEDAVVWHQGDFADLVPPTPVPAVAPKIRGPRKKAAAAYDGPATWAHVVTNPPYNMRVETDDVEALYKRFGDSLKQQYQGYTAWILSGNREALKNVGLRTSQRIELKNGPLDVLFWRYDLYAGSKK
ncbi:MAG: hypothetical protein AAF433_19435 [Bacteroidota bacterium]